MKSIIVFILCFGAVLINDATGIRLQSGYLKPWQKFHNEARDGHLKKIKELLNNGVYVDVFDSDNETALFKAAENNRRSVVEFLLSKHADIHWKNKNGSSPLHAAAFNGHERVVEILIEHGADVNTIEKYGWTSLHVAANRGHMQIVELLLRKKAAVNLQTITGETPLFDAAMAGNDYIVETLIQRGADINIQDQNGWSPLHTATSKGHKKTVRILLKNGANANLKNKKNDTPLDIAIRLGRPKIIEILNMYNDTSTVPPIKKTSFTTVTPTDDSIRPAQKECKSQAVRVSDETKSRQRLDFSEKFPWMAALGYANIDQNSVNFYCGATIISERFVLTAAYCVSWKHPTVVRIGMESATHGEFMTTNFTIKEVIVHPEHSSETKVNDIALIEIAGEVPLTHSISPACLHLDANDLPSNVPLTLITWGARSPYSNDGSKSLRKIEVVSVPLSNCSIKVKNLNRNDLTYGQYCTYDPLESSDGCKGDGGAALQYFSNNSRTATVVGIASFGFACNLKLPAIYTRVAYYLDWIESHVWPTSAPLPSTPITTP
ncbi:serine protease persephone-like, partial [Contarinia nasturtii]|uniref:serine protease persephone-like n=1 Tax=Contarinia nasturtii TaxID=265458 RepID=UPI0012D376FE